MENSYSIRIFDNLAKIGDILSQVKVYLRFFCIALQTTDNKKVHLPKLFRWKPHGRLRTEPFSSFT